MVSGMNKAHAGVSDWGIRHLSSIQPQTIIELGCGGGRNAAQLLNNFPKATLTALDYSEVSVEKTKQVNRREIQHKRCQVLQGDVATLPFQKIVLIWPQPLKPSIFGRGLQKVSGKSVEY